MYLLWRRDTTTRGNKKITLPQIICLQLSALHQKKCTQELQKNILIWDENGGCIKLVLLFMLGNLVKIGNTKSCTKRDLDTGNKHLPLHQGTSSLQYTDIRVQSTPLAVIQLQVLVTLSQCQMLYTDTIKKSFLTSCNKWLVNFIKLL